MMTGFFAISGADEEEVGTYALTEGGRPVEGARMGPWGAEKCTGTTN